MTILPVSLLKTDTGTSRQHPSLRGHRGSFDGKGHNNLVTTFGFHNESRKIGVGTNTKDRVFRSNSRLDSNVNVT